MFFMPHEYAVKQPLDVAVAVSRTVHLQNRFLTQPGSFGRMRKPRRAGEALSTSTPLGDLAIPCYIHFSSPFRPGGCAADGKSSSIACHDGSETNSITTMDRAKLSRDIALARANDCSTRCSILSSHSLSTAIVRVACHIN